MLSRRIYRIKLLSKLALLPVVLLPLRFSVANAQGILSIERYPYSNSTHPLFGTVTEPLTTPLTVRVTDTSGNPAPGIKVFYEAVKQPENSSGVVLGRGYVYTNSQGIARIRVTLGNVEGEYQFSARIDEPSIKPFTLFTVIARSKSWIAKLFVGLIGGLALFFLGIRQMSSGLKHGIAHKMRSILRAMSRNRIVATLFGAFITLITQSSSATAVMLVGFVQSRLLRFEQTIGMLIGAAIGTTITVQLISFRLANYSLLVVAAGFILMAIAKNRTIRSIGEAILGFGLLFYGMHLMSESMVPLRNYQPFIRVIEQLQEPLAGIVVATVFTAIIQSSAAFIGIVLTLATQGLISLEGSIPLLMGANLGTAITGILATIGANRESKKVALAYTLFKVLGILALVWFIQPFAQLVRILSPSIPTPANGNLPHLIANAHTLYNVVLALLILPFTTHFARLVSYITPKEREKGQKFKTRFIDENLLGTPSVAIALARKEVAEMAKLVYHMLELSLPLFIEKNVRSLDRVMLIEKHVNFLRDKINEYLIKLTRKEIDPHEINSTFMVMFAAKELEQIGDIISKNLLEKAEWWLGADIDFSREGKNELIEYHKLTLTQLSRTIEILETLDWHIAKKQLEHYKRFRELAVELERNHFNRLKEDINQSITSSKTHLELVSLFRAIGSHAGNIARIALNDESIRR